MRNSAFVLLISLLLSVGAKAQDFSRMVAPPAMQKTRAIFTDSIQPETHIGQGGDKTTMHRGVLAVAVPFAKTERNSWTVSTNYGWIDFAPDQQQVPDLYNFDLGLTYTEMIEDKKMWAGSFSIGSASDLLFKNPSVTTFRGNYFYVNPKSETETWMFLVNYSNNRPFLNNIPLPGFAYIYAPSKTFRGTFGAPFAQLSWEFAEGWTYNFFTLVPWVLKTSVDYTIAGPAKAYVGVDFSQATYYLHDRKDRNERLFYDEKKLFIGAKSPINKSLFADLEAGYSFDRRFFTAEDYERDPANPIALGASVYVKLMVAVSID